MMVLAGLSAPAVPVTNSEAPELIVVVPVYVQLPLRLTCPDATVSVPVPLIALEGDWLLPVCRLKTNAALFVTLDVVPRVPVVPRLPICSTPEEIVVVPL